MKGVVLALFGLVAGVMLGLMTGYQVVAPIYTGFAVVACLVGAWAPTLLRPFFGTAILGFLISWLVYGGLEWL